MEKSEPKRVEVWDDDEEDEEIDEEEAFNSEDERKYGSFFKSKSEGKNTEEHEDEDSADEGGHDLLDLLNLAEKQSSDNNTATERSYRFTEQTAGESPFNTTVLTNQDIAVSSLVDKLKTSRNFIDLKKKISEIANGKATATPVSKLVSSKASRQVHYGLQAHEMSNWLESVQDNRKAETLDFRHKDRLGELSRDAMVSSFVPATAFEQELHEALDSERIDDDVTLESDSDKVKELKKRQGQLAKMRALMFYHEQKQHQIKKIKSKKYRRIRKRQRERRNANDNEIDEDMEASTIEKEEMQRMKERMTLAHKNTGKWAKRILRRRKNVDSDIHRALSAQLKRGDDLRSRMATRNESDTDDDSEGDLLEEAVGILEGTQSEVEQPTGIHSLSFMQRGLQRQRERAREEARELLDELRYSENMKGASQDRTSPVEEKEEEQEREVLPAPILDSNKATRVVVSSITRDESTIAVYEVDTKDKDVNGSNLAKNPWTQSVPATKVDDEVVVAHSNVPSGNTGNGAVDSASVISEPSQTEQKKLTSFPSKPSENKSVTMLSQEELVRRAFASSKKSSEDFQAEKESLISNESTIKREKQSLHSNGWGSWSGKGVGGTRKKSVAVEPSQKRKRRDHSDTNVIISEKRCKRLADKFMVSEIPYPFKTREEYERSMSGAVGKDWNVTSSFKDMTRPDIQIRPGQIVKPISRKHKRQTRAKL